MAATRRMRAPQPGQRSASTSKTRWSSAAQAIELAGIAVQPQKAMCQHTAAEVGPKFLLDESGCGLARFPSARKE
jgi:hypothetical protein